MKTTLYILLTIFSGIINAGDMLDVCVNYHCDQRQQVKLDNSEAKQIKQVFASPAKSAIDERRKIIRAVATMEQIIGKKTPNYRDLPENLGEDEIGQLDCIAESRNTRQYLQWLANKHYLRWHIVNQRIRRAPMFFDVHWGVKITEVATGEEYVVDSWYGANGEAPTINKAADWLRKNSTLN